MKTKLCAVQTQNRMASPGPVSRSSSRTCARRTSPAGGLRRGWAVLGRLQKWLSSSTKNKFTQQNCGQACPIMHQTEVSAAGAKGVNTKFKTGQGVYFPPSDPKLREDDEDDYDDEL